MRELDQIATDREVAALAQALPYLEVWVERDRLAAMGDMDRLMKDGQLTAEASMSLLFRMRAAQTILDRLKGRVKVAAAGLNRKATPAMLSPRAPAGPEAV